MTEWNDVDTARFLAQDAIGQHASNLGWFCPKKNTVFLLLSGGRVSSLAMGDLPSTYQSQEKRGETLLQADEAIYPSRRMQKVKSGIKEIYAPPSSSLHSICTNLFCRGAATCDCNVVDYANVLLHWAKSDAANFK
ncbi:hypothetical protein DFH08DRAFT_958072 [Mycena albidolilacea]|uniref:Uncharacterized protein n=1 Tax=Mycena albidolilacea TaxID=1033008 RepID=A0AAD7A713_9AGAR|nr:hypothetical protein DFH08DRAFT_958072 [Mycena albidolilacea]